MLAQLPIDEVLDEIVETLRSERALVIEAPPGAGKSTRVPAALLDAGIGGGQQILLLEPRRIAARAIATRIAAERGVSVGEDVGWQIRFERRSSAQTRLLVLTEGILTRRFQSDPFLEGVGLVILDEFHERSIHTDLALAFCRELMDVRDDFKVVVMSATLEAEPIAAFLGSRFVKSHGRTHPVDVRYVKTESTDLPGAVRGAVHDLLRDRADDGGDILVFLPGMRDIDRCRQALEPLGSELDVLRLHGSLPEAEQDRALRRGPRRRVVLSTNIAETSLTIDGVTAVIDSGLVKVAFADSSTGFDRLDTTRISLASSVQRAGRAGRTAPGRAIRLWTQASEFRMSNFDRPELQRIDLCGPVLDVISWAGRDPAEFRWFEAPPVAAVETAVQTLRSIGLVEPLDWRVTDVGRRAGRLPLHPRIARFLLAAQENGAGDLGARVAACLSESDWVTAVSGQQSPTLSDVVLRAELLEDVANGPTQGARAMGLDVSVGGARNTLRVANDLRRFASNRDAHDPAETVRRALLTAYADRIAVRRSKERFAVTTGGSVVLARESTVRDADTILALQVFGVRTVDGVSCGIARIASAVDWEWVVETFGSRLVVETLVAFNDDLERVVARRRTSFDDVLISEEPVSLTVDAEPAEVAEVLAEAAARDVFAAFGLDADARQYIQRLAFLRHWLPQLDVPNPEDPEILRQLVWGATSFADLRKLDFTRQFRGHLDAAQARALELDAPPRYALASGRKFRIDYADPENPTLAAKLQDFFGMQTTPRLARQQVPLLLHLLAPNRRPAQITRDLASFWKNTYAEVRKELRARYPKHDWPEDP